MNDLTEKLLRTYKPKLAIVVYNSSAGKDEYYLESHHINDKGNLMEGKPLRQQTIQEIIDVFFDDRQNRVAISGLIPANLLHFDILPGGNYSLLWFNPAQKRHLFFTDDLKIKSGEAWVPALVYKTDGKQLDVFALATDARPDEKTKLCYAPFHNVNLSGDVCLGNAAVKKPAVKTFASVIKYWEDMFWLSEFSHLANHDNPTKTNLSLIWHKLIANKSLDWESIDELKEIPNTTLKKLL